MSRKKRSNIVTDKETDKMFDYYMNEDKFNEQMRGEWDDDMNKKLAKRLNMNHMSKTEQRNVKLSSSSDDNSSTSDKKKSSHKSSRKSSRKSDVEFNSSSDTGSDSDSESASSISTSNANAK